MKNFFSIIALACFISVFSFSETLAQDSKQEKQNKKEAAIKALVDSQRYSFEAQTALPLGMRTRTLTYGYELKVSKDTLQAYLPYYGKAYTAPIGASSGGIEFKTTDFKYLTKERKKGGWDITITPKNAGDTRQMSLYISAAGYASLQVSFNNKQNISFTGYIQ